MDRVEALTSELGSRLRQRRQDTGRTLADVAGASDVSVSYLAAIESGRNVPSLSVLSRVAHSLGFALSDLLSGSDPAPVALGSIDVMRPGVSRISHPDLRLAVDVIVAGPGDAGELAFDDSGSAIVIHVIEGSFTIVSGDDRFELLQGDSLHAARAAALEWEAGDHERSVSLWATIPTAPAGSA
jgi:transcriptional regulator with XRE-family HTH domain